MSLCGRLAIADATTRTLATNQAAPALPRPPAMGFANAAVDWGGTRWATVVWQLIPRDPHLRARMFLHELFTAFNPSWGSRDQQNVHLDTIDGRYWMPRLALPALHARRPCATPSRFARSAVRQCVTPPKASGSWK